MPWITRFEREVNDKLLTNSYGGLSNSLDTTGLLRGRPDQRAGYYLSMTKMGAMSINEIRVREGMSPIPDGDVHLVEANNLAPLGMLEEIVRERQNIGDSSEPAEPAADDPPDSGDDEVDESVMNRIRSLGTAA
jgi:hypothetical protein